MANYCGCAQNASDAVVGLRVERPLPPPALHVLRLCPTVLARYCYQWICEGTLIHSFMYHEVVSQNQKIHSSRNTLEEHDQELIKSVVWHMWHWNY